MATDEERFNELMRRYGVIQEQPTTSTIEDIIARGGLTGIAQALLEQYIREPTQELERAVNEALTGAGQTARAVAVGPPAQPGTRPGRAAPERLPGRPAPRPEPRPPVGPGGVRTVVLPGPDFSGLSRPPEQEFEVGPTPEQEDFRREARQRLSGAMPTPPLPRGKWEKVGGYLGAAAGGTLRGRGVGEKLAGAGYAASAHLEDVRRYDERAKRFYERDRRLHELASLGIENSWQVADLARQDKAAEIDYRNKFAQWEYDFQLWQARQPKVQIQGNNIISMETRDGQTVVSSAPLDPLLYQLEYFSAMSKLSNWTDIQLMNAFGDYMEAQAIAPQQRLPMAYATAVREGILPEDLDAVRVAVVRKLAAQRMLEKGIDPLSDDDQFKLEVQNINRELREKGESVEDRFGPEFHRMIIQRGYADDAKLIKQAIPVLPNFTHFGNLIVGQ
jgi:hypothetical protein